MVIRVEAPSDVADPLEASALLQLVIAPEACRIIETLPAEREGA